jgi:PBP1b-binding outer membrane lipoprotein LpoB
MRGTTSEAVTMSGRVILATVILGGLSLVGCSDVTAPAESRAVAPTTADKKVTVTTSSASQPFTFTACNGEVVTGSGTHQVLVLQATGNGNELDAVTVYDRMTGTGSVTHSTYDGSQITANAALIGTKVTAFATVSDLDLRSNKKHRRQARGHGGFHENAMHEPKADGFGPRLEPLGIRIALSHQLGFRGRIMRTAILAVAALICGCAEATAPAPRASPTLSSPTFDKSGDHSNSESKQVVPFSATACNGETVIGQSDEHTQLKYKSGKDGQISSTVRVTDHITAVGQTTGAKYEGHQDVEIEINTAKRELFEFDYDLKLIGQGKLPDLSISEHIDIDLRKKDQDPTTSTSFKDHCK